MNSIFDISITLSKWLSQHLQFTTNQLSWTMLVSYATGGFFISLFNKSKLTFSPRAILYLTLLTAIWKLIAANLCFELKVFSIEVCSALMLDACLSILFGIIELVDKKNHKNGLYSMLRVVSHLLPLTLLVIYFPLFHEHSVLVVLLILLYLFKVLHAIRNYSLHLKFELTLKKHLKEFTELDRLRLEKIKNQNTLNSNTNYDLFIYCIWIVIPGFWYAYVLAIMTIVFGIFLGKKANINSIDNPETFMTEVKTINNTIIGIALLIILVFGINFEILLLLSILNEFTMLIAFRIKAIPRNFGILNVGKGGLQFFLFTEVGKTLLNRINPVRGIPHFFKKNKNLHEYAILNNFSPVYETNSPVFRYSEIRRNSRNFILIINNDGSDHIHRIEDDFRFGLNNLMVVLDCYRLNGTSNAIDGYSSKIHQTAFELANWRLNVYSSLCDENFALLDPEKMLSKIHENISTEAILINISIRNVLTADEFTRLGRLEGQGIFELNNLFRQAHETPSIPLRFIINLMVWEATVQYLCGFLSAKSTNSKQQTSFFEQEMWSKELSFGDFISNLAQMLKLEEDSLLFHSIRKLMSSKYLDKEGMKMFSKLLMFYGWKDKIPSEPTIKELFSLMSFIRNKTRGHGIPSKVDFEFFLILEKLSLFLLSEVQALNFGLYTTIENYETMVFTKIDKPSKTQFQMDLESKIKHARYKKEDRWLVKLSSGGCPDLFPLRKNGIDNEFYYPYFDYELFEKNQAILEPIIQEFMNSNVNVILAVQNENQLEIYSLDDFFKSESGVLFAYQGQRKDSKSYISYVTGDLIRPVLSVNKN